MKPGAPDVGNRAVGERGYLCDTSGMQLVDPGDGRMRCAWSVSAPDYIAYHDAEWGVPVAGDRAYFERLTFEAFQSGLSWLITGWPCTSA